MDDEKTVASMFVRAVDTDSLNLWLDATRKWDDRPPMSELCHYVEELRNAFYHDGSLRAKELCKKRTEELRAAIAKATGETK